MNIAFKPFRVVISVAAVLGFILLVVPAACASDALVEASPSASEKILQDLLYVNRVAVPKTIRLGQPLVIKVAGSLPDAAWRLHHLDTVRKGDLITVVPIGIRPVSIMAAQVLRPYEADTHITGLAAGTYQVLIRGRGKNIRQQVIVLRRP